MAAVLAFVNCVFLFAINIGVKYFMNSLRHGNRAAVLLVRPFLIKVSIMSEQKQF